MNRAIIVAASLVLLTGCATVIMHSPSGKTIELTPEEFTHYIAQVNTLHAQVSGKLIRSTGDFAEDDFDEPAHLTAAARKMVRACEPFETIVAESLLMEVTGQPPNLENANSVPACEEATQAVREMLPE